MKIHIEMENKELCSYAGLYEEMGMMEARDFIDQSSKNMSIKSKNFNMSNIRDEENEKLINEMEISAELLIKIIRKLSPIISACKMVWELITNLFEDIAEDIGDEDDWDIEMEDEEDGDETGCGPEVIDSTAGG